MNPVAEPQCSSSMIRTQAAENFEAAFRALAIKVDRLMCALLSVEWLWLIALALAVSPHQGFGMRPNLWTALLAGPALFAPAILTAKLNPAKPLTRHVLAAAQMLVSALLIDFSGGHLETHFHIFGSLAILAFYRDWRVLVTASAIAILDNVVRGIWFPHSIYGVMHSSPWRWTEHAWWILFEDFFLIIGGTNSLREMWLSATREAQLHWGANYDVLTRLANRRLLQERFDSAVKRYPFEKQAILFIDLDRFKQANDSLGHTVGDKLLQLVAARLAAALNEDQTLARIGGDEFIALLSNIPNAQHATDLAARMLAALAMPFEVDGHLLLLSASVGISYYPEHGIALADLQDHADRAMYIAKSLGRNRAMVFSNEVTRRETLLHDLARDVNDAIARGQLQLHFQPILDLGERVTSFEALLRWNHPVHGQISPAEFIPIAERSGLIATLGEWVLAEACRNCRTWRSDHAGRIGVAVNVSAAQFEQPDFARRVAALLAKTGLSPSLLTIELTESILMRDLARAQEHLNKLRNLGIRVALDDFGTGYSSLSYLTTLPADAIKLDRSFVHREFSNPTGILASLVQMAHGIGLRVVAEGVETKTQYQRLLGIDCDLVQGYYFSEPLPGPAVSAWLEAHNSGTSEPDNGTPTDFTDQLARVGEAIFE